MNGVDTYFCMPAGFLTCDECTAADILVVKSLSVSSSIFVSRIVCRYGRFGRQIASYKPKYDKFPAPVNLLSTFMRTIVESKYFELFSALCVFMNLGEILWFAFCIVYTYLHSYMHSGVTETALSQMHAHVRTCICAQALQIRPSCFFFLLALFVDVSSKVCPFGFSIDDKDVLNSLRRRKGILIFWQCCCLYRIFPIHWLRL